MAGARRTHASLAAVLALVMSVFVGAGAHALTPVTSPMAGFDPGFIISDAVMDDAFAMTADEVSSFIAAQGANCTTAADGTPCLKDARFDTPTRSATAYCSAMTASSSETAASYITRVSRACGINPQVLLVLMQKEQGIVSTRSPRPQMYTSTLGFRCPDFQACDPAYEGFVNQVYSAASRLNEYRVPANGFRFQVGSTYRIALHPNSSCGTWTVPIRSAATAALYNYTPYTPNPAALDNPYGEGDSCSSYGNRNFFRIFKDWFGAPNADGSAVGLTRFVDVSWSNTAFVREIQWLGTSTLANGWSDGTFRPANSTTRGEFAAFLYRLAGRPSWTAPATSPFPDLSTSHPFYREITWMRAMGITTGWPDGTFRAESPVLRDQFAAFLYRFADVTHGSTTTGFTDVRSSHVFARQIAWMHDTGLSTGYPDGTYRPLDPLRREQIAAFLYRFDQSY